MILSLDSDFIYTAALWSSPAGRNRLNQKRDVFFVSVDI